MLRKCQNASTFTDLSVNKTRAGVSDGATLLLPEIPAQPDNNDGSISVRQFFHNGDSVFVYTCLLIGVRRLERTNDDCHSVRMQMRKDH